MGATVDPIHEFQGTENGIDILIDCRENGKRKMRKDQLDKIKAKIKGKGRIYIHTLKHYTNKSVEVSYAIVRTAERAHN